MYIEFMDIPEWQKPIKKFNDLIMCNKQMGATGDPEENVSEENELESVIYLALNDASEKKDRQMSALKVPEGTPVISLPLSHFIKAAKQVGKIPVTRALNNLVTWNKNKNKNLSKKVSWILECLNRMPEWKKI